MQSKRALAYIRVSTDGQAEQGVSLDAQKARIRAHCEAQGYELMAVFSDAGLSGSTLDRPQLQEALSLLRQRKADALVVLKLDRLSRSTRHILDLADQCQREGWSLVSLSENLDTSSAAGRFVLSVLGSIAQLEREQTAERTMLALRHLRNTNRRVGEVRFGYTLADDGKTLLPDEAEQSAITKLVLLRDPSQRWTPKRIERPAPQPSAFWQSHLLRPYYGSMVRTKRPSASGSESNGNHPRVLAL